MDQLGTLITGLGAICGIPFLYTAFIFYLGRRSARWQLVRVDETRISGVPSNRAMVQQAIKAQQPPVAQQMRKPQQEVQS